MKYRFHQSRFFLFMTLLLVITGIFLLLVYEKGALFLSLNSIHTPTRDTFFYYATRLGDGWFGLVVGIALLFVRMRMGINLLSAYAISGILAQLLKRLVDTPRPLKWFPPDITLPVVEGIKLYTAHSFPSGHTTSAFAVFFVLAFYLRHGAWQIFCFALALLTAYSRIYLCQHFPEDVLGGAVLGTVVAFAACMWAENRKAAWWDKSLINILKQ